MPRAKSIHIGLNRVDPNAYNGWDGALSSCENDADFMQIVAHQAGFSSSTMKTAAATKVAVRNAILAEAALMDAGDTLMVSYAGHGGQVSDPSGEEPDWADETWCLYDGAIIDDQLDALWCQFRPGVRVIVVSDSCHSGSVTRAQFFSGDAHPKPICTGLYGRAMPPDVALAYYRANQAEFDAIPRNQNLPIDCAVLLLAACADEQEARGSIQNGKFTAAIRQLWANGAVAPGYANLIARANIAINDPNQTPQIYTNGSCQAAFLNGPIFGI